MPKWRHRWAKEDVYNRQHANKLFRMSDNFVYRTCSQRVAARPKVQNKENLHKLQRWSCYILGDD